MVNKAIEDMVVANHGFTTWQQIKTKAGIDVEVFMSNEGYPDEVTYKLVTAASDVLKIPADEILTAFGEHWVLFTAQEGYSGLMHAGGKTLREFLLNLPNFHSRVSMIYPKLQPPHFACSDVTSNSLKLHHHTHRHGLAPFVTGLIQGLAKRFKTSVKISLVASRDNGSDHDVFLIEWSEVKLHEHSD